MFGEPIVDEVGSNESGPARDQQLTQPTTPPKPASNCLASARRVFPRRLASRSCRAR
jgi:hypothetical protein